MIDDNTDTNRMANEGGVERKNQNQIDQERFNQQKADNRRGDSKSTSKSVPGDKRFAPMDKDSPTVNPGNNV